jgi:hypothetical protein
MIAMGQAKAKGEYLDGFFGEVAEAGQSLGDCSGNSIET